MGRSATSGGYTEIVEPAPPATVEPVVSGGTAAGGSPVSAGRYVVSAEPLDTTAIAAAVSRASTGGLATFTGLVRDHNAGRRVRWIDYEAHAPLARTVFARIGEEARERWPECDVTIHHRIGRVAVGEASVVIAAASPHRAEAFSACRFAIERVKQIAPVWKHEHFEGGAVWVEGRGGRP